MAKIPRKTEAKIFIRTDTPTRRDFKRIAADFKNYEELLKWFTKNYDVFKRIAPPYPTPGGVI